MIQMYKLEESVINALIFYFMLAIFLTSRNVPESTATESLRSFIQANEENQTFYNAEVKAKYFETAYSKIPSGFLNILEIPTTLGDGIRVIDTSFQWVSKL